MVWGGGSHSAFAAGGSFRAGSGALDAKLPGGLVEGLST